MSETTWSAPELAEEVNRWCEKNEIAPISGKVGEALNERNVRYYRSLGLLSAPKAGRGKGFGVTHRLQLIAVRLLQSHGLPLRKIQELLFGKTDQELSELIEKGVGESKQGRFESEIPIPTAETWITTPLDDDFLLISRSGKAIDSETATEIRKLLAKLPKK